MTTFERHSVVCGACRHVFGHHALASTNAFGWPDTDTRPPEMKRSTMRSWVQRCPSCGYCAPDAAKFDERCRAVLEGDRYRSQLAETVYPDLASSFVCSGWLAESVGQRDDAGWAYLHAAWVLDDAGNEASARGWRSRAADAFLAVLAGGQTFAPQSGVSEAILADCLRRAGRGSEAMPIVEKALGQSHDDVVLKLLAFQQSLVERGDVSRHLLNEALSGR